MQKKISDWKTAVPTDNFFFRPYVDNTNTNNAETADTDDVIINSSAGTGLLLIYQSEWQKQLLAKYGSLCLMDATYRTTRYALPLFFLCVRTNVDYAVVATFVIQSEDTSSIIEALSIIKNWNENWKPNAFMVDCCEAEIKALDSVFTGNFLHSMTFDYCS